jgi:hypothetical protein
MMRWLPLIVQIGLGQLLVNSQRFTVEALARTPAVTAPVLVVRRGQWLV